jgi:hypothetical protein
MTFFLPFPQHGERPIVLHWSVRRGFLAQFVRPVRMSPGSVRNPDRMENAPQSLSIPRPSAPPGSGQCRSLQQLRPSGVARRSPSRRDKFKMYFMVVGRSSWFETIPPRGSDVKGFSSAADLAFPEEFGRIRQRPLISPARSGTASATPQPFTFCC